MSSLEFHHIGIACKNIENEASIYIKLGYAQEGNEFVDETQGVRGVFLSGPGLRVELLEGIGKTSVLDNWLNNNIKMYHQAYLVKCIEKEIDNLIEIGARVVSPLVPAVAFNGRRICFMMLPTMMMIELIEREIL